MALQEETKALFLQTHSNSNTLYEELVIGVFCISKTDTQIPTLIRKVGNNFDNYRNRLQIILETLVDDYDAKYR